MHTKCMEVAERAREFVRVAGPDAADYLQRMVSNDVEALAVGRSCEAAARGSVVLGRDKKACLADETTARDTLKQNWSKYAASDKNECIGMVTTGGPPSYVELLSCIEILRDARNIRNADPVESDNASISSRRRRGRR